LCALARDVILFAADLAWHPLGVALFNALLLFLCDFEDFLEAPLWAFLEAFFVALFAFF